MANKQDILTAIKNLDVFLKVPALKGAKARINKNGNPFVYVGGFNMVFQLTHKSKKWAFRVWHVPMGENEERYLKISKYLTSKKLPYFAEFIYDEKGIFINEELVDTIRMEWLDGLLFKDYIEKNLTNSKLLVSLADNFLKMCQDLRDNQISHGDLQEGNILVTENGEIKLVDYDSICIPEIEGQKELVTGLKGYQHPSRFQGGKATLKSDYFSELIIYLSILAIAKKPELWYKYQVKDTQYLLFSETDFEDLENSNIFIDLNGLSIKINTLLSVLIEYLKTNVYTNLKPFSSYSLAPVKKKSTLKKPLKPILEKKTVKAQVAPTLTGQTTSPDDKKNNYSFLWIFSIIIILIIAIISMNDFENEIEEIEKKEESVKTVPEKEKTIEQGKSDYDFSLNEARILFEDERYAEAISILNEAFNPIYVNDNYYWLLGKCYYKSANYRAAIIRFTVLNNANSLHIESLKLRANSYYLIKDYDSAIHDCNIVINAFSDGETKGYFYNFLGLSYEALNKNNMAIQNYKLALENDNSNPTYKNNLEKLIKKDEKLPIPTNYLYKTTTLLTGEISPLTEKPWFFTLTKHLRKNQNNEDVYVLEESNPFYFKVYIKGKIGFIDKSSLVDKQPLIQEKKTTSKVENSSFPSYTITVTSRNAYIYSSPERKNKYKTKTKKSKGTILTTSNKELYDDFFKVYYYDEENRTNAFGYIRIKEVRIVEINN